MIKASELRIGNIFHAVTAIGYPRAICKVLTITQNYTEMQYQLLGYGAAPNNPGIAPIGYQDTQPIALTPEILEKCGFERTDNGNDDDFEEMYEHSSGERINKEHGLYKWWLVDRYSKYIEAKHLHQLQNLYFALTGEELTVKL